MARRYHRKHTPKYATTHIVVALFFALGATTCGTGEPETPTGNDGHTDFTWPTGASDIAVIDVENRGAIHVELYPELAPETVANFEKLAKTAFYDGVSFHRVIPGFMIQAGDPLSRDDDPRNDGRGGPDYTIPDEFSNAPMNRGVVAMANRGKPNSGASQFFILLEDHPELRGQYSVFGRVTPKDLGKIDAIGAVPTDVGGRWGVPNRPVEDVIIERVRIQPAATPSARD